MKFAIFLAVLCTTVVPIFCQFALQPVYQVSIWLKPGYRNIPHAVHICNGAIIHPRLILTTADCMFIYIYSDVVQKVNPRSLYVTAGSSQIDIEFISIDVESVSIPIDFNFDRLENDIAVIRLLHPLPVGMRNDIKWITMDDTKELENEQLLITKVEQSKMSVAELLHISNNTECTKRSYYPQSRSNDMCSTYNLKDENYCTVDPRNLVNSTDRGSGVISAGRSVLVGLLSQVIPPSPEEVGKFYCKDITQVFAFYTSIGNHFAWIYDHIFDEENSEDPMFAAMPYEIPMVSGSMGINGDINIESLDSPSNKSELLEITETTETAGGIFYIYGAVNDGSRKLCNVWLLFLLLFGQCI